MKARAAVIMAERDLDQVAQVTFEKSDHRQNKSGDNSSCGEKRKSTNVVENHKWSYKPHDCESPPESVWQRVRGAKSRTSVPPPRYFNRNNIRGIRLEAEDNCKEKGKNRSRNGLPHHIKEISGGIE